MKRRDLFRISAVLVGLLSAALSAGQQAPRSPMAGAGARTIKPAPAAGPSYGPTDLTYVRVSGIDFTPARGGDWDQVIALSRYPKTDITLMAGVYLPSGAVVEYLEFDYYDSSALDVVMELLDCGPLGADCNSVTSLSSSGNPGIGSVSTSGLNYAVTTGGSALAARAIFTLNNGTQAVTGVIVGYRLQVSPAPGTATFGDVPTSNIYFQFIEALAASGITVGCDAVPNYCPDQPITRGQMAVFLAKALGLHFPN